MPISVKLAVVLRQAGSDKLRSTVEGLAGGARAKIAVLLKKMACPVTNEPIAEWSNVQFDHRPALWERMFNTKTNDTVPPANDPNHIDAVSVKGHDIRTHGKRGTKRVTTVGSDSHRRAKIERFENPKPKIGKKIPKRPFPKKNRGFQKRTAPR